MDSKHRKMEDVLQDLGRKIDQMIEDSQLSKIEWKKEIDRTKEILGDKERWKDVEDSLRTAANEFCDAVETAFGFKKP